jgi:alpha-1,2-mannosyltransferase
MDRVHAIPVMRAGRHVTGVVVGLGVLWFSFGHLLAPFDLQTFLRAGAQTAAGKTPYASVTSSLFTSGHAFVYPAVVAWLFAPLALIPAHVAIPLYTALSVAAVFVATRWLDRGDLFAPMLILVSSTTIVGLQMGSVNPILLLGVAAAWRWRTDRPLLSGVCLGAAAGVKLFLAPLLLWPLMRRRYSATVAAAATLAGFLATQGSLGHIGIPQYLAMLSKLQRAETGESWSVASFIQHLGIGGQTSVTLAVAFGVVFLAALAVGKDRVTERQLLGLTVVVCLVFSPIVWSSYLLLMAVPLLLLSRSNGPLVVAALASWVIVTPDQATNSRVAIGIGLALVVSYLSVGPKLEFLSWRRLGVALLAAVCGFLLFLLPAPVRSPLPVLVAMAVVAAWALHRPPEGVSAVVADSG